MVTKGTGWNLKGTGRVKQGVTNTNDSKQSKHWEQSMARQLKQLQLLLAVMNSVNPIKCTQSKSLGYLLFILVKISGSLDLFPCRAMLFLYLIFTDIC